MQSFVLRGKPNIFSAAKRFNAILGIKSLKKRHKIFLLNLAFTYTKVLQFVIDKTKIEEKVYNDSKGLLTEVSKKSRSNTYFSN